MLNELVVKIGAKIDDFTNGMEKVQSKIEKVSQSMKDMGEKLSKNLTVPLSIAGAASIKLASDMQESINKVNVAFGYSAQQVMDWSKTSVESMGLASGSALDAAALFGDMATSMGISQDKAANMAMSLTQLGADLSSFKNIPMEQAMQALNGVFTGETESLKMLGVVMTQTQLEAFALSQGIQKNIKDMSEAELVNLRYAFVLDRTKNAQGDFARTQDGAANQMRIFSGTLKEIGIQIGNVLLPIFNKFLLTMNSALKSFTELPDPVKKIIVVLGGMLAAIGPVLLALGSIGPAIASAISMLKILSTLIKGLSLSFALFTNPIFLTIAAIGALVVAGVYLYKNWDAVKQRFEEMRIILVNGIKYVWEKFKYYIAVINPLLFVFIEGGKKLYENWEVVKIGIISALEVIKNGFVEKFGFIFEYIQKFMSIMATIGSAIGDAIGVTAQAQIEAFGTAWKDSGIEAELALSREKYALEQRIKAINENAGKTDYMTNRSLIMSGQLAEEEKQLKLTGKTTEQLAEEKRKAAEAAKLAADKAKELTKQNESLRKSAIDAADALGNALVTALQNKRKAEEDAIRSAQNMMVQNDIAYQNSLETIRQTQEESAKIIDETNRTIIESINSRYDEIKSANNSFYNDQISENQRQIDAISRQIKTDQQEAIDEKFKANVKSLSADEELQKDRKKLVEKFIGLVSAREDQAFRDGRTVRLENIDSLNEEENRIVRDHIFKQREMYIKGITDQNASLKAIQDKNNIEIEANRARDLENQRKNFENQKKQLISDYDQLRAEEYRSYNMSQMQLDSHIQAMKSKMDAYYQGLSDKQKAYEEIEKGNQKSMLELLKKYNPDWYNQGQSFGERLLSGLKSKQADIESAIADILKKVADAKNITVPEPTKANPAPSKSTAKKLTAFDYTTNLAMFANGGIVTAPTLSLVGEGASPEAIIPLNRLNDFVGQNQTQIFLDGREITQAVAPRMVDHLRTKLGVLY